MKEIEFFDTDFLGDKIEIGDKVILETPKYRDFAIGTVVSKAPKSCQVEYQSFCTKSNVTVRQYYEQLIKYPIKEGKWVNEDFPDRPVTQLTMVICSVCGGYAHRTDHGYIILSKYCPNCGSKMLEDEEWEQ